MSREKNNEMENGFVRGVRSGEDGDDLVDGRVEFGDTEIGDIDLINESSVSESDLHNDHTPITDPINERESDQGSGGVSDTDRGLVSMRRKFLVGVLSVLLLVMIGSVVYELSFDKGYELSVDGVQSVYVDYLADMNDGLLEGENLANLKDTYFSEQLRADVDLETSRASFEETIGKGMTFNGEMTGTKIVEDPEGNVIRIEVSVREWLAVPGEEVLPDEKGIGLYTFVEEEGRVVISDMVDYSNATEVDEDGKIKE